MDGYINNNCVIWYKIMFLNPHSSVLIILRKKLSFPATCIFQDIVPLKVLYFSF